MIPYQQIIECAKESKVLCFDIEYSASEFGFHTPGFDLHGCGFATICNGEIVADYYQDREEIQEIINECFNMEIHCIAHFSQTDIAGLLAAGYYVPDYFLLDDTILILSLLDENRQSYGLKQLAKSLYGIEMEDYNTAASEGLDSERFYKYGKLDVMIELKLFCDHYEQLKESPTYELYREHLTVSIRTFADIMLHGMYWDEDYGRELFLKIVPRIRNLEEKIYASIGRLNLGSTKQLARRLFVDLGYSTEGLPLSKTTKAVSVNAASMVILAKRNKVCKDIVTWRSLKKILSTYITSYMTKMKQCGKVYGTFSIHSDTGRTRCSDSNCQNVPTKMEGEFLDDLEIRKGFVPRPGKIMAVADFAGLELRGAATVTQEPMFQNAFRQYTCKVCGTEGESNTILHNCPECGVFEDENEGFWHGLDLHSKTRDEIEALNGDRKAAKAANFQIIYLATAWTMHNAHPALSVEEWDVIIREYLRNRPNLVKYHKHQENLFRNGKPSYDIFGRRRFVKPPKKTGDVKKYKSEYKRGLNMIVNAGIQSPCAAITQMAQNTLRETWIKKGWWKTKAIIINSVHDEIITEFDEDIKEQAIKDLQWSMESQEKYLDCPLRAQPSIVNSWAEKG